MPTSGFNLENVFHAALEFSSDAEREQFLQEACRDSPSSRSAVDRLLKSHRKADVFLEQCPELEISQFGERLTSDYDPDATQLPKAGGSTDLGEVDRLPRRFGDYHLLEKIAAGGMGVVYMARQISLNRDVAIKMILSGQFAGQDEIDRFYFEAETAGRLDHYGIVRVFEVGQIDGQHYFSMAPVMGGSLNARIKEGVIPPREAALLAQKIALTMQFAHDHGVMHRDLKPGNILLDEFGEPRVTDFGLARRVEGNSDLTRTGMVLGTPSYMPPEQASGKAIDISADVYSLGAILYAMLVGRPPFDGGSPLATLMKVLHEEPISLRSMDRSIPRDLEAIVMVCLEKSSANRYASCMELADDLGRYLAGEPIQVKNNMSRRVRKWSLREPVLAAHLAATLVLAALMFFCWFLLGESPEDLSTLLNGYAVLAVWGLLVLVLQKAQNVLQNKSVIPYVWAAINPVFMTGLLAINRPPRGALLATYFLLVVVICLFRKIELVAITTGVSLLGIAVLVFVFFDATETAAPSHLWVFCLSFIVSSAVLGFIALRLHRLERAGSVPTSLSSRISAK